MKIIGEGESGKYICEIDGTEIANILGYDYANAAACPDFGVGGVIDVKELYNRVKKALLIQESLKNSLLKLRTAIETIETAVTKDILIQPPRADGIRRVIKTKAMSEPQPQPRAEPTAPEDDLLITNSDCPF